MSHRNHGNHGKGSARELDRECHTEITERAPHGNWNVNVTQKSRNVNGNVNGNGNWNWNGNVEN